MSEGLMFQILFVFNETEVGFRSLWLYIYSGKLYTLSTLCCTLKRGRTRVADCTKCCVAGADFRGLEGTFTLHTYFNVFSFYSSFLTIDNDFSRDSSGDYFKRYFRVISD